MTTAPRARLSRVSLLVLIGIVLLWSAATSIYSLFRLTRLTDSDDTPMPLYSDALEETDWSARVSVRDRLHLSALHRACIDHKDSVIPWTVGLDATQDTTALLINQTDPNLVDRLRVCPDVDVFIPGPIRGYGYCEDAVAYAKYLHARMMPRWAVDLTFVNETTQTTVTYHDLCPHTPMLFLSHYWDGVRHSPTWPATKPLYLMPNMEMYELEAEHFQLADVVLCKTAICARYVDRWFAQEGNPRNTRVIYTRHTSTDLATNARVALGDQAIRPKDFTDVVFTHAPGSSHFKGTSRILDCWLARPDLPPLELYVNDGLQQSIQDNYGARISTSRNVRVHSGKMDAISFGKMIAEASFFLCPSWMEGYGHYLNQARAAGGVVITTDVAPMNELVSEASGVLVAAQAKSDPRQFLGGTSSHPQGLRNVRGFMASFNGESVCAAVDRLVNEISVDERQRRAERGRQQYYYDTVFFAQTMRDLRLRRT